MGLIWLQADEPMRAPVIKHVPFQSIYRQEYEVVEERRGDLSLYPHTDQLPVIFPASTLPSSS